MSNGNGKSINTERKEVGQLSEQDIARRDRLHARNKARPERPQSVFEREESDGGIKLTIKPAEGQDEKLYSASMLESLGTRSIPFLSDTLDNLMRVMSPSRNVTEQQYNAAVAILAAVEPESELEAALAAQMVAANECSMRCMRAMVGTDWADHHKMYGELANKFMRTFTAQLEALAKLRRGGEQVVKHVYVQEGGQAVIAGTVNTGGGSNLGSDEQPYGAAAVAGSASLPCANTTENGVPIPGNAERALQTARRPQPRPTQGE